MRLIGSNEFEIMHAFLGALDMEDYIETVIHQDNRSNWWCCILPAYMSMRASPTSLKAEVANMELLKAKVEAMG